MKRFVLPIALAFTLAGCGSKDLTRSKAARIMKESVFNKQKTEASQEFITIEKNITAYFPDAFDNVKRAEKVGWVTFTTRKCGLGICGDSALTDRGMSKSATWRKQGENWIIPTRKWEFGDITGIETFPAVGTATAHYTWRWIPTEDGKTLGFTASEPLAGQWNFKLFDDGWRANEQ
jgi:hypothetical protein